MTFWLDERPTFRTVIARRELVDVDGECVVISGYVSTPIARLLLLRYADKAWHTRFDTSAEADAWAQQWKVQQRWAGFQQHNDGCPIGDDCLHLNHEDDQPCPVPDCECGDDIHAWWFSETDEQDDHHRWPVTVLTR